MIVQALKNCIDICKFQTGKAENLKSGAWDLDGSKEI
jgi:hypothetical protein